ARFERCPDSRVCPGRPSQSLIVRPRTTAAEGANGCALGDARSYYAAHADEADTFAGEALPPETSAPETAAWTATARIVMNLDEFITRE
ncbi:MAG: hypothetical protein AB7Q45_03610, partial [Planctomycetaceae bacterium]